MLVVEVAVEEDGENDHKDACRRPPIAVEPCVGNKMDEPSEVEQEEDDDEIEHDEDGGGAYLIEYLRQWQRQCVKPFAYNEEKQPETPYATDEDETFPCPMQWQQGPDVPSNVCDANQWQEEEEYCPHFHVCFFVLMYKGRKKWRVFSFFSVLSFGKNGRNP